MTQTNPAPMYFCPMHTSVRQAGPGKCSACGMDLVPEGTRFGLLRHMAGSPLHLGVMLGGDGRPDGGGDDVDALTAPEIFQPTSKIFLTVACYFDIR